MTDEKTANERTGARFDAHMMKLTAMAAASQLTAAATRLRAEADALDLAAKRITDGVAEVQLDNLRPESVDFFQQRACHCAESMPG